MMPGRPRMSRRLFLGAALAGPPLHRVGASDRRTRPARSGTSAPAPSIEALETRYRRELFDEVMPFWERHGIDRERGGITCALDYDGTPVDTHTFLWFQGRGLWVFSRLSRASGDARRWLEPATRAATFALTKLRQPDGSWAQRVTRDGQVLEPANPADTSGLLYMAEGLQEYAAAAHDREADAIARELVVRAYETGRTSSSAQRRQGLWFLTLLVCTQMLTRRQDAALEQIARDAADAIVIRHHNPDTGLNDEIIRADLTRAPDEAGFTVFGHSIEALWMVMDEARRRGDEAVFDLCAARVRHHVDVGWDRVYGGLAHAVRVNRGNHVWPVERPVGTTLEFSGVGEYHYMKTSWALFEVIVAALKVLEHRPAAWAADALMQAQDALDRIFSLRGRGSALYVLFGDRQVRAAAHATRQDNYHHPRALILALGILERLRTSGRVSLLA